jgi:hypothetical protein
MNAQNWGHPQTVLNLFKRTMPPRLLSLGPTFRSNRETTSQLNRPELPTFLNWTSAKIAKSGVVSKVTLFQCFLQTKNQFKQTVLNRFKRTMPPRLLSLGPTFRSNRETTSQLNRPKLPTFLNRTSAKIAKSGVVSKVTLFQCFLQTKNQL